MAAHDCPILDRIGLSSIKSHLYTRRLFMLCIHHWEATANHSMSTPYTQWKTNVETCNALHSPLVLPLQSSEWAFQVPVCNVTEFPVSQHLKCWAVNPVMQLEGNAIFSASLPRISFCFNMRESRLSHYFTAHSQQVNIQSLLPTVKAVIWVQFLLVSHWPEPQMMANEVAVEKSPRVSYLEFRQTIHKICVSKFIKLDQPPPPQINTSSSTQEKQ